jgi:tetratricopeptide (TPR) repeat protein
MIDVFFGWGENPSESFKKYFEYTHKAISLDDSSPMAHSLLGEIYRRKGQYEKAIAEGKKAIALEPNNDIWNYNLSRAMFFAGRPEDAIELIKKAIRLSPVRSANYFNVLGQSLHRAGRYEEALIAHAQALEGHKKMGNNPFWVHNGFTAAYLELGKIENARSHFKEALATNPNNNFIGWAKVWLAYKDEDLQRLKRLFEPLSNMAEMEVKVKLYIHGKPPTFKFKYPEGIIDLQLTDSDQVLRKRIPGIGIFAVMVADIPKGMSIIDTGQNYFLPKLRNRGIGTNFTVVSNESITLEDGTNACKTEINWLYKDGITWMTTSVVSAYKKNKLVCLSTSTAGDSEKIAWIAESLTFQ